MRISPPGFVALAVVLAAVGSVLRAADLPDDPEGRKMVQEAHRAIAAYHAGQPKSGARLRIVYFHPSDRDPLPNYAERLDRVMTDVSDFYRDGLGRFGVQTNGLPLERKDGRLVLHVVRGKLPASAYTYESGGETRTEIAEALQGRVDLKSEHVLVLYGLCRQEPDGRYVFDAPYYGGGDARRGLSHAADCELLDPLLLTETRKKIVKTEHYYPRHEQTVAGFNSWYLGGIAHELGHGLGLDHDAGEPAEQGFGTSLMGSGNHTYRQEVWGGGRPTFLSRASALLLAAHPLFTGSDRGRREEVGIGFAALTFVADGKALEIRGVMERDIEPHAVVAQVWPACVKEENNHAARTFPTVVRDGAFTLRVAGLAPDTYAVNLTSLHVNGGVTTRPLRFVFDAAGRPDVAALNATWRASFLERAEVAVITQPTAARRLLRAGAAAGEGSADARRKLQVLRAVLDPVPAVDLASVVGDRVYLSDVNWIDARVGWGQAARNHTWFDDEKRDGVFLKVAGRFFDKGLYAHSASRYAFDLGGRWKTLTATVGLRDGAHQQGSAVFTVRGDGRELHRSRKLRVGASAAVKVNVAGVRQLELIAEGGEGHVHNSWAIWAEPELRR